ncbi:MAG: HEAT repeat domain-containing protein [Planctomycetales bacterium]|nr:HEAT repeat domain-containing protein [Planctomycetales bacterium]
MHRTFGTVFVGLLVSASHLGAAEITLNGHTFTLPDGFIIEVAAAGKDLAPRPITASFDEAGRLYVSDSSGSNEKTTVQLEQKPHRIVCLEDTDGDGRFDKSTVFADKMMFPEGTLWFDGSLYVAAPPSIWKLTDADGDGVAEHREEWFQGKTLTGCANDLHGPYLGPDGWIYWCKGAFAEQTYERPNGKKPLVTKASHIFRCRPNAPRDPVTGSVRATAIESVMTGGMDNPVDVVFTPNGERIFSTTFLIHPGGGLRDGLIHAVYGGVYGKVWNVLDNHPHTGDTLPALVHLGPAAPCGLECYQSRTFGDGYFGNVFASCFNLHKITRHVLEPAGATFKTQDSDFVVSNNLDFHPTDVLEDADGSLLIVDTGGWYKLCCPTSQLWKPDVLGAIYRVRRTGAKPPADPRGQKLDWGDVPPAELVKRLDDPRPAVRDRVLHVLGRRKLAAVEALTEVVGSREGDSAASSLARRNAVWALTRIRHEDARDGVALALSDPDDSVRQVAIHSISLWRDPEVMPPLFDLLENGTPHNRRAAAEALGRTEQPSAVPRLLAAAANVGQVFQPDTSGVVGQAGQAGKPDLRDRMLEHSITFALIEIAHPDLTRAGLKSNNSHTRRAALIALDQMEGGGHQPEVIASLLASPDPIIKETASWIISRHTDWGASLVGYFRQRLTDDKLTADERTAIEQQLVRFARDAAVQQLVADIAQTASGANPSRLSMLRVMAQSGLKETPPAWTGELVRSLSDGDAVVVTHAVAAARVLPAPKDNGGGSGSTPSGSRPLSAEFAAKLLDVGRKTDAPAGLRLDALASVPGGLTEVDPALLGFLREHLHPDQQVSVRSASADVLAKAKLAAAQLVELSVSLPSSGPLEVDRLLAAFEKSKEVAVGLALVAGLKQSTARSALRIETLKPKLAKFGAPLEKPAAELFALIEADNAQQRTRLDELLAHVKDGDIRRGQLVFNSTKTACSACHSIGYLGGKTGPDLTRIGQIRTERDLLEAIVFPSISFVRSYEPMTVVTKAGKVHNGLLKKDAPDEVILQTGPKEEVRIPRDDIEEFRPGTVSVMPAALDKQLTPQELADLVTFLKACR